MTMAIPDVAFSAVRFCSYTARRIHSTIGLLSNSYASFSLVLLSAVTQHGSLLKLQAVPAEWHGSLPRHGFLDPT